MLAPSPLHCDLYMWFFVVVLFCCLFCFVFVGGGLYFFLFCILFFPAEYLYREPIAYRVSEPNAALSAVNAFSERDDTFISALNSLL